MLQQTRVAAVMPYYERFLQRFPTVESLAAAREEEVLVAWAGLGYYSRARNLHKAARRIVAAGAFPHEYEAIRELPGVGDYTAAAVSSIAFNQAFAAVDGNVLRVLSRLKAEPGDIQAGETRKRLQGFADELLNRKRPGDFNQALMELGATVCLPKTPLCLSCPVATHCEARKQDRTKEYPIRARKDARHEVLETLCYIERGDRVLFWQRPPDSRRLASFWELPLATQLAGAHLEKKLGEFRHTIVNTTYCIVVMQASLRRVPAGFEWLSTNKLHEVLLSTTAKKALLCLTEQVGNEEE